MILQMNLPCDLVLLQPQVWMLRRGRFRLQLRASVALDSCRFIVNKVTWGAVLFLFFSSMPHVATGSSSEQLLGVDCL